MMSSRRVVVTGLGIVSPVGNDVETAWQNVVDGRSGIGPITDFDASDFSTTFGGCIKDFDPTEIMSPKELRKIDTFMHYGIAASVGAFNDSQLEVDDGNAGRFGVCNGFRHRRHWNH